jgi:hypothetical protein
MNFHKKLLIRSREIEKEEKMKKFSIQAHESLSPQEERLFL